MANKDQFQSTRDFSQQVIILIGESVSGAIDVSGCKLVGLVTDNILDGIELTFQVSNSINGTFYPYKCNDSNFAEVDVKLTVSQGVWYGLNATDFAGAQFLKIVSNQVQITGDTVIKLILEAN